MTLILAIVAGALLIAVLAAAAPVRCSLVIDSERTPALSGRVELWGGLVRRSFGVGHASSSKVVAAADDDTEKPLKKRRRSGLRSLRRALAVLRSGGLTGELWRFVRRLWATLGVRDLQLRVDIGLDDPAATGEAFGVLMPIAMIAKAKQHNVQIRPHFDREVLRLQGACTLAASPLRVAATILGLALRPRLVRAAWAAWRTQ